MARASQTEVAVLGGLSVQPMTGYALREAIRDVLGHFWSESYGQIYPTLAHLEQQGFVRRQDSARTGASTFAITPSGTRRLEELLAQPIQATPPRNGLLLRLYFGRHLGPTACRTLVQAALTEAQDALRRYAQIRAEIEAQDTEDRDYWLLTVSAGEHSARATQAWAHEALSTLAELHDDPTRTRPGRTS
jgi:DNA-binding PadR family transcriptional regulator